MHETTPNSTHTCNPNTIRCACTRISAHADTNCPRAFNTTHTCVHTWVALCTSILKMHSHLGRLSVRKSILPALFAPPCKLAWLHWGADIHPAPALLSNAGFGRGGATHGLLPAHNVCQSEQDPTIGAPQACALLCNTGFERLCSA